MEEEFIRKWTGIFGMEARDRYEQQTQLRFDDELPFYLLVKEGLFPNLYFSALAQNDKLFRELQLHGFWRGLFGFNESLLPLLVQEPYSTLVRSQPLIRPQMRDSLKKTFFANINVSYRNSLVGVPVIMGSSSSNSTIIIDLLAIESEAESSSPN